MMQSGKLKQRVTIERPLDGRNEYGERVSEWEEVAEVHAWIRPLRGQEFLEAQRLETSITHRVVIRYRKGITSDMRLRFEGRTLSIIGSPIDPEERHRELHFMCAEAA